MQKTDILHGHTSPETAYEIKDYPWGYKLRTSRFVWIESKKGKGDRFCHYTIDPRNGKPCKTKEEVYCTSQFLYLNDEGHVKSAGMLDAHHIDKFPARFKQILELVGAENINEVQRMNIKDNFVMHLKANAPYVAVKYKNPQVYLDYIEEVKEHIYFAPFEDMINFPAAPEQDNPEGKVEFRMVQVVPKPEAEQVDPAPLKEAIKAIIEKELPRFWFDVSDYKGWEDKYISIEIAAKDYLINGVSGQRPQAVSLSLNLSDLKLQPQMYGGNGGQCIYRKPNKAVESEKWLAMVREKVPFRTPKPEPKAVLRAIELFCKNYKETLIKHFYELTDQDKVDYDKLLNG